MVNFIKLNTKTHSLFDDGLYQIFNKTLCVIKYKHELEAQTLDEEWSLKHVFNCQGVFSYNSLGKRKEKKYSRLRIFCKYSFYKTVKMKELSTVYLINKGDSNFDMD